ncbi:MAG: hypothetical protein QOF84_1307 [Streptomyces sp.]|jgi:uncharacterized membrane-anchored protein|nr:hypothetical protein [Micromonosporaceae bacterium]MDX6313007.1 hypothetical protein [Streptomyces sp.]MDX6346517.1 hypothetical protein [Streptomyces sp.]
MTEASADRRNAQALAIKVPAITAIFWAIKILTTGMGESAADLIGRTSLDLWGGIGAAAYLLVTFAGFVVAVRRQLRARTYHAPTYWLAVSMVAVFGTTLADVLSVGIGVPFAVTSVIYAAAVAILFTLWFRSERTLSIHSIVSGRPERFYWATVLATFALGTAVGDLTAMTLNLGFFLSGVIFLVAILVPLLASRLGANAIAMFWVAYVLTRPLGASFADWLGKKTAGGLGLGDAPVTLVSLVLIVGLVAYVTRRPSMTTDEAVPVTAHR